MADITNPEAVRFYRKANLGNKKYMAIIIDEHTTCDGHNVTCLMGETRIRLHFLQVPTSDEKAALIRSTEYRLLNEVADSLHITNEDTL